MKYRCFVSRTLAIVSNNFIQKYHRIISSIKYKTKSIFTTTFTKKKIRQIYLRNSNNSTSIQTKSKKLKAEETYCRQGLEWFCTRPWAKGLGRRHGMMGAWCGASSSLDLVAQVCQPPPSKTSPGRPLEEDGDGRVTSTCRWSRREVPTCRSPLVAARSRRVSRAGYQERGGARPSWASRRLARATTGRVAPVLGRRDALSGRHAWTWVGGRTSRVDFKIFEDSSFNLKFVLRWNIGKVGLFYRLEWQCILAFHDVIVKNNIKYCNDLYK